MQPQGAPRCPLCKGSALRKEKAGPDQSADVIDCGNCGIYEIGRTSQAQLWSDLRDESHARAITSHIKSANDEGFVFRYPDGARIANHHWLQRR